MGSSIMKALVLAGPPTLNFKSCVPDVTIFVVKSRGKGWLRRYVLLGGANQAVSRISGKNKYVHEGKFDSERVRVKMSAKG